MGNQGMGAGRGGRGPPKTEEERQREERAHKLLEESARSECDRLIRQIQEEAGGLIKKELGCQGQDLVEFLQVKDRTEKYVQSDHSSVRVTRIEKVINMDLELMFLKAKKELKSGFKRLEIENRVHNVKYGAFGRKNVMMYGRKKDCNRKEA